MHKTKAGLKQLFVAKYNEFTGKIRRWKIEIEENMNEVYFLL
jgi:hypothetical protein